MAVVFWQTFFAAREDVVNYTSSGVIQCWFIVMKYIKESSMRDKLFDILQLLHRYLDLEAATFSPVLHLLKKREGLQLPHHSKMSLCMGCPAGLH